VVFARGAEKSLTPASTVKLFTTAAALDALGPEARLRTTVETAATLVEGQLGGDLYLVGRGDPELAERGPDGRTAFDVLADALVAVGLRRVEGRVVGQEGAFSGERRGPSWEWQDLVWCYGAEVAALSWNGSCADLIVAPGVRVGAPATVTRAPPSAYYAVQSAVTTSPRGSEVDLKLERDLGSALIRLSGTIPAGAAFRRLSVALEDPARYAATVFAEELARRGVQVSRPVETATGPLPDGLRVLASHEGAPLAELIQRTNKSSDNLRAETLLHLLGREATGEGDGEGGLAAEAAFLGRIGISLEGVDLVDGSGLAPTNLVTAHALVDLLAAMAAHRYSTHFRDSLAIAGVDGTLERRLRGTAAEGRILGKTGTRRHAHSLAGYATTLSGERLAFAILVDHQTTLPHEAVLAIDEIAQRLVTGP
jgi:D-alanyl-D-alanine carboxypeptidase/D-alanyl-D-alanine-endopeptidase (penicillin-binding protein 4)